MWSVQLNAVCRVGARARARGGRYRAALGFVGALWLAAPAVAQDTGREAAAPSGERGASKEKVEANEEVRKEDGGEVKVVEFSGLDIEGQLKTPQMLYFLNRLRAEFGRPRLPHRSFMPELQRSAHGDPF